MTQQSTDQFLNEKYDEAEAVCLELATVMAERIDLNVSIVATGLLLGRLLRLMQRDSGFDATEAVLDFVRDLATGTKP